MSFLHAMKTGKRKYDGNMKKEVTNPAKKIKQRNHFTQGKTGYVPRPCSNPVNIRIAKRY